MLRRTIAVSTLLMLSLSACIDDSGSSAQAVEEDEPNDEIDQSNDLGGPGTYRIQGTCSDDIDMDYYCAAAGTGDFSATLTWDAGSFEMSLDPDWGISASMETSTSSPISLSGQVEEATSVIFAVDCYNEESEIPAGLAYEVRVTVPGSFDAEPCTFEEDY